MGSTACNDGCYYVYFENFLDLENASCVDRQSLSLPEVISILTVLDSTCLDYVWDENLGNGEAFIKPEENSQLLKQFSSSLNLNFWNINRLLFPLPHLSFYYSRNFGAGQKRKSSLAVKIELEARILIFVLTPPMTNCIILCNLPNLWVFSLTTL